jgi:undecaprenyl-diphosphatase
MDTFQAIVLGIIQGLTEFLPISSTAHLRVIPALLGWKDPGAAFTAVIQWGTWVAVVIYFRQEVIRLLVAFFSGLRAGKPFASHDARLAWMIIVGTVPIVVLGMLLKKQIEGPYRSLYVVAAAAIVLAVVMLLSEVYAARRGRPGTELEGIGWRQSLLVGFAQVLAVVPGASRSGVTITGGLFAGMNRSTAARFSFLLSLPAVFGAGLYELYKERDELLHDRTAVSNLIVATVVSAVVGYGAIAFLITFLRRHSTGVFVLYRLALGAVLLILLARGVVAPDEGDKKTSRPRDDATTSMPERRFSIRAHGHEFGTKSQAGQSVSEVSLSSALVVPSCRCYTCSPIWLNSR